ncbi:MAG: glutamyl-tRNA reductase [Chloroflexota bacterium]
MADLSSLPLLLIGINHKMAPVEVRERLAFSPERIPQALLSIKSRLERNAARPQDCPCDEAARRSAPIEVTLLSTCNRTEVYVVAPDQCEAQAQVMHFLSDHAHRSASGAAQPGTARNSASQTSGSQDSFSLAGLTYSACGLEAAHHLLRVAAGLDSLVLGENEILGQVRDASEIAQQAGTSGALLATLFRYAIQTGKRVRAETDLGHASLSVASVVVELAEETFGSLAERTALLIGAGKVSSITGRALVNAGLSCVLVANRTYEKAQKLAHSLGYTSTKTARENIAVHFDALAEHLVRADIVICSTGAPHIVLHKHTVEQAMRSRSDRPLLIADLAVPRDADPEIGQVPNVHLADIDDLERLVTTRHPLAAAVRQQAETIVEAELEQFDAWYTARRNAPVIQALRAKAETICQEQISLTLRRLGDVTSEQQRAIQQMAQSIVNKLLHEPITSLKTPPEDLSASEYTEWVETLFGLHEAARK